MIYFVWSYSLTALYHPYHTVIVPFIREAICWKFHSFLMAGRGFAYRDKLTTTIRYTALPSWSTTMRLESHSHSTSCIKIQLERPLMGMKSPWAQSRAPQGTDSSGHTLSSLSSTCTPHSSSRTPIFPNLTLPIFVSALPGAFEAALSHPHSWMKASIPS